MKINTNTKEWGDMFKSIMREGTGMRIDEALEIVLELARTLEDMDVYEWEDEHAEACGIVDKLKDVVESM